MQLSFLTRARLLLLAPATSALSFGGTLAAPPRVRTLAACAAPSGGGAASVTGVVYSAPPGAPTVSLYTKEGCTLCDEAKAVLMRAEEQIPHTLEAVDITDADKTEW